MNGHGTIKQFYWRNTSISDTQFVGKIFIDGLTNEIRLSEYWSSVIPISIGKSIGKKKNTDDLTDRESAPKTIPARNLPTDVFRLYFQR
jgi:hypothetical protein